MDEPYRLNHEALDDTVEDYSVVVPVAGVGAEVFRRLKIQELVGRE